MVLSENDIEKIKGIFTDRFLQNVAEKVAQIMDKRYANKFKEQEKCISNLQQEVNKLKSANREMANALDNQEQASRNCNVRIFGVPADNNEDLRLKIQNVFKQMKVNINTSQIKKCHRIRSKTPGDKPPAVLVRFFNDTDRLTVLKNRKNLKSTGVQVREDLTKNRLTLLSMATNKFTTKNAWCSNGVIYIKVQDVVHRINNRDELDDFEN